MMGVSIMSPLHVGVKLSSRVDPVVLPIFAKVVPSPTLRPLTINPSVDTSHGVPVIGIWPAGVDSNPQSFP